MGFESHIIAYSDKWKFLSTFLREMDLCLLKFEDAIERKDVNSARDELHQMLGATRILKFIALESKILDIQTLLKDQFQSQASAPLLSGIHELLEDLFRYLVIKRPLYNVYLISSDTDYFRSIQNSHPEIIKITFSNNKKSDESAIWLSSSDIDLIIYDYDGGITSLTNFSDTLESLHIEIPMLLVSKHFDSYTPASDSNIPSLHGRLLKSPNLDQLVEGIKTIGNGRNYWQ